MAYFGSYLVYLNRFPDLSGEGSLEAAKGPKEDFLDLSLVVFSTMFN